MQNRSSYKLAIFFVLIFFTGCEHPKLFHPTPREETESFNFEFDPRDVIIHMKTTGGQANIDQDLFVLQNRQVILYNEYPRGSSLRRELSRTEYDELRQLFVSNSFFNMQSSTDTEFESNRAPSIVYEITFRQFDLSHDVKVNASPAEQGIQEILNQLNAYRTELETSLNVVLSVTTDTLDINTSIGLTLRVENLLQSQLVLEFATSQTHDFKILDTSLDDFDPSKSSLVLWQWSKDQVFSTKTASLTLQPKQVLTFNKINWNGQRNNKERVEGPVVVIGELVSDPGGRSRAIQIEVNNE